MSPQLQDAYATCLRLARSHYENFPVASWLLPAQLRPHIAAIYAFARVADDFADEPGLTDEERFQRLEEWRNRLHTAAGSRPASARQQQDRGELRRGLAVAASSREGGQPAADAIFVALHDTIDRFDLPIQLFDDLLSAFRQDVATTRYATWTEVLDYCRRSANPVGRLVLRVFGYRRDDLDACSDAFCTALQLTNFWQDFTIDWSRGRLYVPEEVWQPHAADPSTLSALPLGTAWQMALREVAARTWRLFDEGRPVCDGVSGRLRYELRATWLGGTQILHRLERAGFDGARPALGVGDGLVIALRTVAWRRGRKPKADSR